MGYGDKWAGFGSWLCCWITLGKYFPSHCLSFPIWHMEVVKYLLHRVLVRIKRVNVHYTKGFAQRKHLKKFAFLISGSDICIWVTFDSGKMRMLVAHYFLKILYGTKKLNIWEYLFYLIDYLPRVRFKKLFIVPQCPLGFCLWGWNDGWQHGIVGGTRPLESGKPDSSLSSATDSDLTSFITCKWRQWYLPLRVVVRLSGVCVLSIA